MHESLNIIATKQPRNHMYFGIRCVLYLPSSSPALPAPAHAGPVLAPGRILPLYFTTSAFCWMHSCMAGQAAAATALAAALRAVPAIPPA